MREQGSIVDWNDDKGCGFIKPDKGGADVFVHINSIDQYPHRPRSGDRIQYTVGTDRNKRPRAEDARILTLLPSHILPYIPMVFCAAGALAAAELAGVPYPLSYFAPLLYV